MVKAVLKATLKNGDLSYTIRVANGRLKSGKTKYLKRSVTIPKDYSEAKTRTTLEKATFELEEKVKRRKFNNGIVYFEEYANTWLYFKRQSDLAPSTIYNYERDVTKLIAEFGQYRIDEITAIMIIKFQEKLRTAGSNKNNPTKGLKDKTIIKIYDALHNILECAIDDEIIFKNPLKSKNFPKPKPVKKEIEFLEEEDIIKLANALENNNVELKYQCITRIALGTGARIGEIQALEWKDIDFQTGEISITKTISRMKDLKILEKPPKTKNSIRKVSVGDDVIELLKEYKDEQEEEKKRLGDIWLDIIELYDSKGRQFTKKNDKLFTQWNGLPIYNGTYGYWLKKFTKKHKFKPYTPHSFRHTFATLSVEKNQPINAVSETLGHADKNVTFNMYVKSTDKSKEVLSNVMSNKMRDLFNQKKKDD